MSELTLDPRSTAIVVIDTQKGIVMAPGDPLPMAGVVANVARLLAASRRAGAHPVLVHVGFSAGGLDALKTEVDEPMRRGPLSPDWTELIPEVERQPEDTLILKRQWGAFYGTDMDLQLRRRGLTTIVMCGVATEFGVESTARDAWERGYEMVFAADAMTGRSAESHNNSLTRIFPRIGRVRTTDEIITALQR
jgi:nicotinamidase-related amidase